MDNALIPTIYVVCLASYNAGKLHGEWIEATQDEEDVHQKIQAMLAKSPIPHAEEWSIHEHVGFGRLEIDDYDSIETICEYASLIEEYGAIAAQVIRYYGDIDAARDALENQYHGEWNSEIQYAQHLFDDCYAHAIPEQIRCYVDYKAFSHDLFINDYFSLKIDRNVHVFSVY